jgi:hypothetical protein
MDEDQRTSPYDLVVGASSPRFTNVPRYQPSIQKSCAKTLNPCVESR